MSTPFDIRVEVLKMAKEVLEAQFYRNQNSFQLMIDSMMKLGQMSIDIMDTAPKAPTTEEILKEAEKFYTFVGSRK